MADAQQWNQPPDPNDRGYGGGPNPPPGGVAVPKARTGLITLVAVLVELALVAAIDNQGVTDHVTKYGFRHPGSFGGQAALTSQFLTWRFTPASGDHNHIWLAQILAIAALVVVTALLVVAVTRGPVTFGRAFFGTWMAVIVASGIAGVVGAQVAKGGNSLGIGHAVYAVFFGPSGTSYVFGFGLGLLTALITGLVAVVSRKTVTVAANAPLPQSTPQGGPQDFGSQPGYGPQAGFGQPPQQGYGQPAPAGYGPGPQSYPPVPEYQPPAQSGPQPGPGQDSFATTQFAPVPAAEPPAQTTEFPRFGGAAEGQTTVLPRPEPEQGSPDPNGPAYGEMSPSDDDQKTTVVPRFPGSSQAGQFPRPPDDEDLGHQPD